MIPSDQVRVDPIGRRKPSTQTKSTFRIDPVVIPLLLFAVIFIPHLGFVPLWDGRAYADALVRAAQFPVRLPEFNIFGHPSMAFMLLAGFPQFFFSGNVYFLNLADMVFGMIAIGTLFSIAKRCFPGREQLAENTFLASIFAVLPVVVASELNFNPDTGVLAFSLVMIALLLAGRFRAAAIAGVCLMYSKESGVLLYPLILGCYLLAFVLFERAPLLEKVRETWKRTAGFSPVFFFAAVTVVDRLTSGDAGWKGATKAAILNDFATLSLSGIRAAYMMQVWVLNFNWFATAFIVVALVAVLVRILRRRNRVPDGTDPRVLAFVAPLALFVLYGLTRFQTFTNPRYIVPIYPFFVLGFSLSLRLLFRRGACRMVAMSVFFGLALVSCFRTIDPASKALYGTFPFGRHPLLHMTSLAGDCCGYSRDQLTYNLEYTHLHSLQNAIFESLRPKPGETFVVDHVANWFIHGSLDPGSFRRTLRMQGMLRPRYLTTITLSWQPRPPSEIYYIVYPNVDNAMDFEFLPRYYDVEWVRTFEENGYSVPVIRMALRRPWVAPQL